MYQIVDSFKSYLSVLGYSSGIQSMLPACIHDFLEYGQYSSIEEIGPVDINLFYEWLHERPLKRGEGGLSEMMISHYVYALKVFFSWQLETGGIAINPVSVLKFKSPERGYREPLTVDEIQTLFNAAFTFKEYAMLHLFYSCGLRRSEAVWLRLSDVQFRHRLLYVRSGKGARRRVIPLTGKVADSLEQYVLQERGTARYTGSSFMLNRMGRAMTGKNYVSLLKSLLRRADMCKDISPHYLRHSIATHLLQNEMSMEYVRDFLGHQCLESTQIYARPGVHQLQAL
ncbi:integrase/recombinase XerD [Chitinophaga polysaccharea]|uniref:Integrase/recombinase XerD n=1 Tax=Chitinophaga polysaccharea TaxID=1293035 RepID=A0A561PQE0_9BACT|nr:tyrosine-type recombinase/integrase [Chitinophaga polysaccharea]TWF40345.1 integrase/recombinase XerD [Chitinophaga polysaccharea]